MPTFVVLGRLTTQAKLNQAKAAKTREQTSGEFQRRGVRVTSYTTLGPYDFVDIVESPSEELMVKYLMTAGASGDLETTTLRAFGSQESEKIRSA